MSARRESPLPYITRNSTFEISSSISTGDAHRTGGVRQKMSVLFRIIETSSNSSSQTRGLHFPFDNVDMFLRKPDSTAMSVSMLNHFRIFDATLFRRLTGQISAKLTEVANNHARDGSRSGDVWQVVVDVVSSYVEEEEELEIDSGGSSRTQILLQKVEKARYDGGVGCREKDCAICIQDFCHGEEIAKMPCSHIFHDKCFSRWMERGHVCPLCRYDLFKEKS